MAPGKTACKSAYWQRSVAQAMGIITTLLEVRDDFSLDDLGRRIGATKNKTFRLLATLVECGIVEKNRSSKYRLGSGAVIMARRILAENSTFNKVRPILAELAEVFGEDVYLASYSAGEATLVDLIGCRQQIKAVSLVGKTIRLADDAKPASEGKATGNIGGITVGVGVPDQEVTTVMATFADDDGAATGAFVVVAPTFRMPMDRVRTEIAPVLEQVMRRMALKPTNAISDPLMPYAIRPAMQGAHGRP